MKKLATLLFLALCLNLVSHAQKFEVNINDLTTETQIMSDDPDRMRFVWWIPDEYWIASLSSDPETAGEEGPILDVLNKYTVFAVTDGEIGVYGSVSYVPLETMIQNMQIVDSHGDIFKPLKDKEIDGEAKNFLAMMKPVFASMLGPMGENMHFVLFSRFNLEGKRLLDPLAEADFDFTLFDEIIKFELPLGSLFEPKTCPIDGKKWNGTWVYCPKHGGELVK